MADIHSDFDLAFQIKPSVPSGIWAVGARCFKKYVNDSTERLSMSFFVCEYAQRRKFDTKFNSATNELGSIFGIEGGVGPAAKVAPNHIAWGVWNSKLLNKTPEETEFVVYVMKHGLNELASQFPHASFAVDDWLRMMGIMYPTNLKSVTLGVFSAGMQVEIAVDEVEATALRMFDAFVVPIKSLVESTGNSARQFHPNDAGLDMNKWWVKGSTVPQYIFYDFKGT
jgi:hypothetical protein